MVGNQYGFVITNEFPFAVTWNGEDGFDAITFSYEDNGIGLYPSISSNFGRGIFTVNTPFVLRTPPNVNLMTMAPPNFVIPNITYLNGVIEADNLRYHFTFNLKIQMPHITVVFPVGTPIGAFLPIPRNFQDDFEVVMAEEIFDEATIVEENQASQDFFTERLEVEHKNGVTRQYWDGLDVYGNEFQNHQKP